jgi:hypothetical protein
MMFIPRFRKGDALMSTVSMLLVELWEAGGEWGWEWYRGT